MTSRVDRRQLIAGSIALAAGSGALTVPAMAQSTRLKLILNWRYQGPQAWFFIADDKGYFKDEGLEIVIDQGDGSGAAVGKVASGAYDIGFGDINALIQLSAQKPTEAPICVQMLFNSPPFTIAVKKNGPIKTPKDMEGRTIGGAANDGALKLFPAFAKLAGIDASKVNITNMQPNLRENMLHRDQVDGVFGYVNTIRFSARLANIDADKDWKFFNYGDYGMDLYSNAMIVSRKLVASNPKAVTGLVRAINRGLKDTIADPKGSIAYVTKREPLIKPDIEYDRLIATLQDEMNHPELSKIGLGDVDDARLKKSIEILVEADKLPRTPDIREIFDRSFLPPLGERPIKVIG
jgi:NitT/TauT family transport system substrate-binding protein